MLVIHIWSSVNQYIYIEHIEFNISLLWVGDDRDAFKDLSLLEDLCLCESTRMDLFGVTRHLTLTDTAHHRKWDTAEERGGAYLTALAGDHAVVDPGWFITTDLAGNDFNLSCRRRERECHHLSAGNFTDTSSSSRCRRRPERFLPTAQNKRVTSFIQSVSNFPFFPSCRQRNWPRISLNCWFDYYWWLISRGFPQRPLYLSKGARPPLITLMASSISSLAH